ncbi:MAG: hypothetical protein RIS82_547 [Actinomycetota bacterium]|jgi:hypothetical protein
MKSHDHEHINADRFADSAGVPWAGRSFEQNPFADDDGTAPHDLVAALAEFQLSGDASKVFQEIAKSRLLIPLLADLGESGQGAHGQTVDKSADLSIVTVKTPDGETGLPVFSSVAAMAVWNKKARPVPSDAVRVALAAVSEGNKRVILDPGSPTEFVLRRPAIEALAQQKAWIPPHLNRDLFNALTVPLRNETDVRSLNLRSGDLMSRLTGPELIIALEMKPGLAQTDLESVISRLISLWSAIPHLSELVDSMKVQIQPGKVS